jgi:hypothetical protein
MAPLVSHFWSSAPGAAGSNAEAKEKRRKKKGTITFWGSRFFYSDFPFLKHFPCRYHLLTTMGSAGSFGRVVR